MHQTKKIDYNDPIYWNFYKIATKEQACLILKNSEEGTWLIRQSHSSKNSKNSQNNSSSIPNEYKNLVLTYNSKVAGLNNHGIIHNRINVFYDRKAKYLKFSLDKLNTNRSEASDSSGSSVSSESIASDSTVCQDSILKLINYYKEKEIITEHHTNHTFLTVKTILKNFCPQDKARFISFNLNTCFQYKVSITNNYASNSYTGVNDCSKLMIDDGGGNDLSHILESNLAGFELEEDKERTHEHRQKLEESLLINQFSLEFIWVRPDFYIQEPAPWKTYVPDDHFDSKYGITEKWTDPGFNKEMNGISKVWDCKKPNEILQSACKILQDFNIGNSNGKFSNWAKTFTSMCNTIWYFIGTPHKNTYFLTLYNGILGKSPHRTIKVEIIQYSEYDVKISYLSEWGVCIADEDRIKNKGGHKRSFERADKFEGEMIKRIYLCNGKKFDDFGSFEVYVLWLKKRVVAADRDMKRNDQVTPDKNAPFISKIKREEPTDDLQKQTVQKTKYNKVTLTLPRFKPNKIDGTYGLSTSIASPFFLHELHDKKVYNEKDNVVELVPVGSNSPRRPGQNSLLFPELFEDRVKIDYFVKKTVDYVEYQSSSGGKDNNDKMWSFPNYEAIYNTNGNKLLWWDHVKDWPDLTSDQKMKSNPFINHNKNAKNLKIMQANGNLIKERADKDRQIYAYNQNKLSDEEKRGSRGSNLKSFIKKWQITEEEMKNGKIGIVVGDNGEACAVKLPDRAQGSGNAHLFIMIRNDI